MLTETQDRSRLEALLQLLAQHQIAVYPLTQDWQYEQTQFRAGQSYYVPLQQTQYRLLKAAFRT
ncbi:hypothetical protein, partial [Alishewanella longhuensis]